MRNLIIKVGSSFVLMFVLTVLSVQAQTQQKYTAWIPFDFQVANKTFTEGNYNVFIDRKFDLGTILTFLDADRKIVGRWITMANGRRVLNGKTVLMFDRFGDRYVLRQMVSEDFGFDAPKPKVKKWIAARNTQPDEIVVVFLAQ